MTESVDTVHGRARRPRLPGGLHPRPDRALRGRLLAPGPAGAGAHARGRGRLRPGARLRRASGCATRCCSSARRSRGGGPGSPGRRRAGRPRRRASSAARGSHVDAHDRTRADGRRRARRSRPSSASGPGLSRPAHRRARPPRLALLARPRRAVGHRGAARAGADLPHARAGARGPAGGRARQAAADRPRPAQDARARLDLGRERRRRGRARLGREQDPASIDGVLVLGDLASRAWHKPWVVPWSNGRDQPPIALAADGRGRRCARRSAPTRAARARPRSGRAARCRSRSRSRARSTARACPAVLLQISGERGPAPDAPVSRERFTEFGRGALRAVTRARRGGRRGAASRAPRSPDETDGIVTLRNVLPDWSVRLLVLCLLLPALLAALDAFFRARRRHLRRRLGRLGARRRARGAARLGMAARARHRRRAAGAARPGPARRPPARRPRRPRRSPRSRWRSCWASCSRAADALGAAGARQPGGGRRRAPPSARRLRASRSSSGCSTRTPRRCWCRPRTCGCSSARRRRGCAGSGAGSRSRPGCSRRCWCWSGAGRAQHGPFALARHVAGRDRRRPRLGWSALALGALAGCVATLVRVLRARAPDRRGGAGRPRPRTRGPAGYAGPGSLGGTESALRR